MTRSASRTAVLALSALALALALACGCDLSAGTDNNNGGNGNDGGSDGGGTVVAVSIGPGSAFAPPSVTASPGDTVRWTSVTSSRHTVASDTPEFNSDDEFATGLVSGDVFEWLVPVDAEVGTTVFYHCRFHATAGDGTELGTGMVGSIAIGA